VEAAEESKRDFDADADGGGIALGIDWRFELPLLYGIE
jgi:hypothetical protein